jgi:Helix-turn-helix domain
MFIIGHVKNAGIKNIQKDIKMTQNENLLNFLKCRGSNGASSLEIINNCGIINTTGRISDLRKEGYKIECKKVNSLRNQYSLFERHEKGVYRFYLNS